MIKCGFSSILVLTVLQSVFSFLLDGLVTPGRPCNQGLLGSNQANISVAWIEEESIVGMSQRSCFKIVHPVGVNNTVTYK